MTKNKLPIIIGAVVVLLAGAYFAGIIGPKKDDPNANKRYVVPPVEMASPFTVNTSDADGQSYLAVSLALQLDPMKADAWKNYSGAGAKKEGAAEELPGAVKVASYPKFRNAVIETASQFSAADLRSHKGKEEFKQKLLDEFGKIYEVDAAEAKAAPEDPKALGLEPPYKIKEVYLSDYAVQ